MSDSCCNGPTYTFPNGLYNATQVRLYGIPGVGPAKPGPKPKKDDPNIDLLKTLNDKLPDMFPFPIRHSTVQVRSVVPGFAIGLVALGIDGDKTLSPGVIFGYAYEGHCYDLPKPKIMLIPAQPGPIPDGDCGYDLKQAHGYKVWIVDKLDQCVDIDVSQGYIEQMVLEANLPGQRSPTMYAAKARLAHRSGRLTD